MLPRLLRAAAPLGGPPVVLLLLLLLLGHLLRRRLLLLLLLLRVRGGELEGRGELSQQLPAGGMPQRQALARRCMLLAARGDSCFGLILSGQVIRPLPL